MHKYFIRTPWLVRKAFASYTWKMPSEGEKIYLSFDDGPHPEITPWVLDRLKEHGVLATFFCIGNNVKRYPGIYERILAEGHAVGNHSYSHMNGWKTPVKEYVEDVQKASGLIKSSLYRPPYGRIRKAQAKQIGEDLSAGEAGIIMWDVLSADFDRSFSPQQCLNNVTRHARPGSIVVFHDSEKAFRNLEYALPGTLNFMEERGYRAEKIVV
ncbi:MAG TPA: polysaccharide deacetylase family protein [Flavisolibacter sp.]|nr:polysaccharide deacetylase family protein [Flavisolibacter sp.]